MDFPNRRGSGHRPASEGAKFLGQAKEEHAAIFHTLLEKADTFSSVETYTDAIEAASWKLTEALAKESWRNGVARGQTRQR